MFAKEIKFLEAQFAVIGGGLAGLCAAVSASRNGVKTILVQDRPMFGGNCSSEIRMWICGAEAIDYKESGLIEELQLKNLFHNPGLNYHQWDMNMYSFAKEEENLTILLNTSVNDTEVIDNKIASVSAWNLTEQCLYKIKANLFSDCSGDGILRQSNANFRTGREAKSEFNESLALDIADKHTMGSSILLQVRKCQKHVPFIPPKWANKYNEDNLPPRYFKVSPSNNFWWIEIGGMQDTINDADLIRDELYKIALGVWDFIKNHPDKRGHQWDLAWIGVLPGKRENVRFEGKHILNQNDIDNKVEFEDMVAYGGWTMDNHSPAGFEHFGDATDFNKVPEYFEIPFRSLYSSNIENLLFAGRQISATHLAMSATRVMGTCAIMGQAVGTAVSLCTKYNCLPDEIYQKHIKELQNLLIEQDQFLPNKKRQSSLAVLNAEISSELLRDGVERDIGDENHAVSLLKDEFCSIKFADTVSFSSVRIILDSDLHNRKKIPCIVEEQFFAMPEKLVRNFALDIIDKDNKLQRIFIQNDNYKRLVDIKFDEVVSCNELRFVMLDSWGNSCGRIFSLDIK